jgi:hypothetical protein
MMQLNPQEQEYILRIMEKRMPTLVKYTRRILEKIKQKAPPPPPSEEMEEGTEESLPEQKPPRREGEKKLI